MDNSSNFFLSPDVNSNLISSHRKIRYRPSSAYLSQKPDLSDIFRVIPYEDEADPFVNHPSIVNAEGMYKIKENSAISDFSLIIKTTANASEKKTEKPTKKINSFDAQRSTKLTKKIKKAKTVPQITKKKVKIKKEKKKLKIISNIQFDSETEDVPFYLPLMVFNKTKLRFVDLEKGAICSNVGWSRNKSIMHINKLITKPSKTEEVKSYKCHYCPKEFPKKAALGGHTAKNHPQQSGSYFLRQQSLNNRKLERERSNFFNSLCLK